LEYRALGRTGLRVSRLCLGTMTFGLQCDEETSRAILDTAAEHGITFLDTADVYPSGGTPDTVGRTETILGRWLRRRRDDFIVATKCCGRTGPRPWDGGCSRKHILDAVDKSLRRLDTDHVDLYQLHHYDPSTPIEETLQALDSVVRSGKARYAGCSNFLAYQLARALGASRMSQAAALASVQARYNLLFREMERELFPLCAEEGIGVLAYSPLAGGMLTGKHDPGQPPAEGTRFAHGSAAESYRERYWSQERFATVAALRSSCQEVSLPLAQVAAAWVWSNPVVTAVIVGASRPEHVRESIRSSALTLPDELLHHMNEISIQHRWGDAQW
jgi:1-deoxyxylulose-5-phosphate synthase